MSDNYKFGNDIQADIEEIILMFNTMRVSIDFNPRIAVLSKDIFEKLSQVRELIIEDLS